MAPLTTARIAPLWAAPLVMLLIAAALPAGGQALLNDSEQSEAARADAYFKRNDFVDALPLYEHLAAMLPGNIGFAERLAFCRMSRLDLLAPGPDKQVAFDLTKAAVDRAKALGDNSAFLQVVIDRVNAGPNSGGTPDPTMAAAETAFAKGDLDTALQGYRTLAAQDPRSYEARLFAGDIYFRKHDAAAAGEWFQQAIDVDPDRETAYRYWGDTLVEQGKTDEALQKFIDAVVAQPYQSRSWNGLNQWAKKTGATLSAPRINIPQAPTPGANGKPGVTITVDADSLKDPQSGKTAWLAYSLSRAAWRQEKFAKAFPDEKQYRHSLAEEADALESALLIFQGLKVEDARVDPGLRELSLLARDGMLEPFILLTATDSGIARDYAAYRATHRSILHDYIERHVVHRERAP